MEHTGPRLLVFSSLFPSKAQPTAGLFIRERMFRVGQRLPLVVVSPKPWFPGQGLIRLFKPHFRPTEERVEEQDGFIVYQPRFLSVPGLAKSLDGRLMALSLYFFMRRIRRTFRFDIIDAHFGYPDGYAAIKIGYWLKLPVTITMRGTEVRQAANRKLRQLLIEALAGAARIFTVSDSLRQIALRLGVEDKNIKVIPNGVDIEKFQAVDKSLARNRYGLPRDAQVMITVGGLVERKGYHRVIKVIPELLQQFPDLHYLIVGGASAEGNWTGRLKAMVQDMGLEPRVHFLGVIPPDALKWPLSAADLFVLSTSNEGWANVLLEAMACGLPVVATDVGGNAEVVCHDNLGIIIGSSGSAELQKAIARALVNNWESERIIRYARENSWGSRIDMLVDEFVMLGNRRSE